jgi:hypothetical protein
MTAAALSYEEIKSQNILTILEKRGCRSFLEVGIGPVVKFPQHAFLAERGIAYTGVDFSHVCAQHSAALSEKGLLTPRHRFLGNDKGSPNFNLIGLLDAGESFDLVYFDLHHTLNVDAVPAVLSTLLVAGSGLIAFDDVQWTLANAREGLAKSPFYASIYDFNEYTEEQMRRPHVKVIIESILLRIFELAEDGTVPKRPGWKVYRKLQQKPPGWNVFRKLRIGQP